MDTVQIVLLTIAGLIILFVIISSAVRYFKSRSVVSDDLEVEEPGEESFPNVHECKPSPEPVSAEKVKKVQAGNDGIMMISVHAKPNHIFSGYNFLQTLGSVGLVYGEHKIFHYDVKTDMDTQRLFSVAQLNKPGTFDIDHVENIRCRGLLLFIDLQVCSKQTLALDCMLETAYQLSEDLEGIMFEGYNTPWHDDTPRALSQQLESYQRNNASMVDEITS